MSHYFKVVWYYSREYGFVGKIVGIPDTEVAADCRDGLKYALLEHAHNYVDRIRRSAGLPQRWEHVKLKFERISEEEFGPLFDETWDEE